MDLLWRIRRIEYVRSMTESLMWISGNDGKVEPRRYSADVVSLTCTVQLVYYIA